MPNRRSGECDRAQPQREGRLVLQVFVADPPELTEQQLEEIERDARRLRAPIVWALKLVVGFWTMLLTWTLLGYCAGI